MKRRTAEEFVRDTLCIECIEAFGFNTKCPAEEPCGKRDRVIRAVAATRILKAERGSRGK